MSHHEPGGVDHHRGVVRVAGAVGHLPAVVDPTHLRDTRRRVDLAAAGTQAACVSAVDRGDVDLAGSRFEQPAGDPVGSDHLRGFDGLVRSQHTHRGDQLHHGFVHRSHRVEVAMGCHPDQRERFQQRTAEPFRWILHESPAGRREHSNRAAAVALEERRHRSAGGVVGERGLHLEQADRTVGGQLVADRDPGDAAADDQHVVRVHQGSLPLGGRNVHVHRPRPPAGVIRRSGHDPPVRSLPLVLLASA